MKDVFEAGKKPISDPIKKNSLTISKSKKTRCQTKQANKLSSVKDDLSLFCQMYVAVQHRDSDMGEFFKHETCPFPPSLTDNEKMRFGKKSDLLKCLREDGDGECEYPQVYDCTIFDAAALVHALSPNTAKTFDEYAEKIFSFRTSTIKPGTTTESMSCGTSTVMIASKQVCGRNEVIVPGKR